MSRFSKGSKIKILRFIFTFLENNSKLQFKAESIDYWTQARSSIYVAYAPYMVLTHMRRTYAVSHTSAEVRRIFVAQDFERKLFN